MAFFPKYYVFVWRKKKLLTFIANTFFMKWLKLTVYTFVFSAFLFSACEKEAHLQLSEYVSAIIYMTGAQEVPAVTTNATGTIVASYSQYTKTLTYRMTWSGLSGNATAAHIHGIGEAGIVAGVLQDFTNTSNTISKTASGIYNGSLFIDGTKFTEELLLAGKYYMNIHTAANPGGEIRGQLILSKL
jgi:hypothetical protein